ncbi:DUF4153 domain-containing protein [Hafnia paralvei]|uniref:DUF4153 domain-containing protein n=1 Tax=Hafnia paralvei TaxID=546367 RepID=UPI003C2B3E8F
MSLLTAHHSKTQVSPSDLPLKTRIVIVLVCLIQGCLLYLCNHFSDREWMIPHSSALLYTQVLSGSLPLIFVLSVNTLRDKILWKALLAYTVIFVAMTTWVKWNDAGVKDYGSLIGTFYLALCLMVFVTLPWLQARINNPSSPIDYSELHGYIWKNTITVVLTLLVSGLMWGILSLGAGLFKLIGIDFFYELFFQHEIFMYLANGLIVAIGVLISRTHPKLIITVRNLLSLTVKGLLPLLSFFALIFIFSLPFTGIDALTDKWSSATTLLTTMSLLLALLVNAIYLSSDGIDKKPYPNLIRYIINGSLLVLPIYAILSTYYLGQRIVQYGWTPDRLWASVIVGLSLCLTLAYASAVVRKNNIWLHSLGSINKKIMWLIAVAVVLCNSPIIDPYRISVNDQINRYSTGKVSPDDLDLVMLRFDSGRRGNDALQALRSDVKFVSDPRRKLKLEKTLMQTTRWGSYGDDDKKPYAAFTPEIARKNIQLAAGTPSPESTWWESLPKDIGRGNNISECYLMANACVVTTLDLNNDGNKEPILCNFSAPKEPFCQIYVQRAGKWRVVSRINFDDDVTKDKLDSTKIKDAILNGQLKAVPKEWSDIQIQDTTVDVSYYNLR